MVGNQKNGYIGEIRIDKNGAVTAPTEPIFSQLGRPLSVNIADLNGAAAKITLLPNLAK